MNKFREFFEQEVKPENPTLDADVWFDETVKTMIEPLRYFKPNKDASKKNKKRKTEIERLGKFKGAEKVPYTPFSLIKVMIEKSELSDKDVKVCVLYTIEAALYLSFQGFSNITVVSLEHDRLLEKYCLKFGLIYKTIDEIEKEKMKFDFIIGNPPYQSAKGASGQKLWDKIYSRALLLLKPNAKIALLTPSSFLLRDGHALEHIRKAIMLKNLMLIDFDANDYFEVGDNIVLTIVHNTSEKTLTSVVYNKQLTHQDLTKSIFPMLGGEHDITHSIFQKVQDNSFQKLKSILRDDVNNSQKKRVNEGVFSETQNSTYLYPVIYTPNTTHYAKELFGDKDKLKLMITLAGTWYSPQKPNRNIFISTAHSGQGMIHILIESEEEGNNIKSYLTSKLYRFFIQKEKTSGYNTGVPKLPILDSSRTWSDQEVYEYFDLTQEEIDLIESSVK